MLKMFIYVYFVDFVQIHEKWCWGCWMMVRSWLYDVVVVVLWCSHQFMLWVLMKVLLWLSCGDFAIFVKMGCVLLIFGYQSIDWFWTFNLWTFYFYFWEGKKRKKKPLREFGSGGWFHGGKVLSTLHDYGTP